MRGADIAVGGTTSGDIVSREEWLKPGCTFISLARRELDPAGWSKMDKVVIDTWEFNMLQREFKRMVECGLFSREQLHAEIQELVAGAKKGRERDDERILIHTTGLVSQDVALAHFLYRMRSRRASGSGCPRRTERIVTRQGSRNRQEHGMSSNSRVDRRGFLRNAGRTVLGATAAGGLGPWASSATAQEKFPARDINWIIYQAPGGSIDTTARIIQPYLERNGIKTTLEYVLGAGGRVARTQALHRAAGRLRDDDEVGAGRRDRRGDRPRGLQGQRVHPDLRLERRQLAALRKEGFADPTFQRSRRRVQKAPRRHRHDRPRADRAISSSPRCRRN